MPTYDVYLDPKNDFLINDVNPGTGYRDLDKITAVEKQNGVVIFVLNKNQLDWQSIEDVINGGKGNE